MINDEDNFELPPGESWILPDNDTVDIEVKYSENTVVVQFTGFDDEESAEQYANSLAEVLPTLLYGTTTLQ